MQWDGGRGSGRGSEDQGCHRLMLVYYILQHNYDYGEISLVEERRNERGKGIKKREAWTHTCKTAVRMPHSKGIS